MTANEVAAWVSIIISVGNLIGSDLFNLLGVLGLAAVINPRMVVDPDALASVSVLIVMVVQRQRGGTLAGNPYPKTA